MFGVSERRSSENRSLEGDRDRGQRAHRGLVSPLVAASCDDAIPAIHQEPSRAGGYGLSRPRRSNVRRGLGQVGPAGRATRKKESRGWARRVSRIGR